MKDMEFKEGDFVYHPTFGFAVLESHKDWLKANYKYQDPLTKEVSERAVIITRGGRPDTEDLYRSVLTVEEAGRLGINPPKKPTKIFFNLYWDHSINQPVIGKMSDLPPAHDANNPELAGKFLEWKGVQEIEVILPFLDAYAWENKC